MRLQYAHKPPSNCFIPFSGPLTPLSMLLAHPTHEVFSTSMSNRIDEYVQRSMERDYPRVARNIYFSVCMSVRLRMYASPYVSPSLRVYHPPCVCPLRVHVPPCACSFRVCPAVCMCPSVVCPLRVWIPSYDCSFTRMFPPYVCRSVLVYVPSCMSPRLSVCMYLTISLVNGFMSHSYYTCSRRWGEEMVRLQEGDLSAIDLEKRDQRPDQRLY